MGVAVWLSKRSGAAILVVALAAAASLRATLSLLFGSYGLEPFMASPTGFAGWLFQSAWVPQHLMSASCVVAADAAHRPLRRSARAVALVLTLVLIVVAGFESSTYVGGVTFAVAAVVAAPILFAARRAGAAPSFCRRAGGGRRAGGSSSPHRSFAINWRPLRRAAAAARSSFIISTCSASMFPDGAAPRARSAGLLAHSAADRISGDFLAGVIALVGHAAQHRSADRKNRRRRS